jgi:hypothetical protein
MGHHSGKETLLNKTGTFCEVNGTGWNSPNSVPHPNPVIVERVRKSIKDRRVDFGEGKGKPVRKTGFRVVIFEEYRSSVPYWLEWLGFRTWARKPVSPAIGRL